MKRSSLKALIFFLVATFGVLEASAQRMANKRNASPSETQIGIRGGANFFTWGGGNAPADQALKLGANIGAIAVHEFGNNFGISGEVNWTMKGAGYDDENVFDIDYARSTYLEIPIMFNYFISPANQAFRPKVFAGPAINSIWDAKVELTGQQELDQEEFYNEITSSAIVGLGFHYATKSNNRIIFDVRYVHGLADIFKDGAQPRGFAGNSTLASNIKNRGFSVNVGFTFPVSHSSDFDDN